MCYCNLYASHIWMNGEKIPVLLFLSEMQMEWVWCCGVWVSGCQLHCPVLSGTCVSPWSSGPGSQGPTYFWHRLSSSAMMECGRLTWEWAQAGAANMKQAVRCCQAAYYGLYLHATYVIFKLRWNRFSHCSGNKLKSGYFGENHCSMLHRRQEIVTFYRRIRVWWQ